MSRIKLAATVFAALGAAGMAGLLPGGASAGASATVAPAPTRALARDVLQHLIAINYRQAGKCESGSRVERFTVASTTLDCLDCRSRRFGIRRSFLRTTLLKDSRFVAYT